MRSPCKHVVPSECLPLPTIKSRISGASPLNGVCFFWLVALTSNDAARATQRSSHLYMALSPVNDDTGLQDVGVVNKARVAALAEIGQADFS